MALRWRRVVVEGWSMAPTLLPGDRCRVRWGAVPAVGDLVVCRRPGAEDLLVVKRAARHEPGGWWVTGDNEVASDDSREFGLVPGERVLGVVRSVQTPRRRRLRRGVAG